MSNKNSAVNTIKKGVLEALVIVTILAALALQPAAASGGQTCGAGCAQSNVTPTVTS